MPANLQLSLETMCAFFLVLARVSGALVFVPLPGISAAPGVARAVLAAALTLALSPRWPAVDTSALTAARLAGWAIAEAVVGLAIGVCITVILEAFTLAAQVLGLQAGYAYASTIDPNTQADSGILLVLAQLFAGLLFFAVGLDREILRLFARSLERIPPGAYVPVTASAETVIHLASNIFSVGLRLALPVVALLAMVDIALALLSRINAQLQLLTLAFPAKMLIALMVLTWVAFLFPRLCREVGSRSLGAAQRALGI